MASPNPSPDDITFTFTPFTPASDLGLDLTPSFASLANSVRRTSRALRNRLQSIAHDAAFVERVRRAYELPVLTNARAGDWYVDPSRRQGGVYFKSTDGHAGEWGFSLRRLNLGLLEVAAEGGGRGAIVVDSTRRGKRFPDSLSKTIPIWIAVMNKVAFPEMPLELSVLPQAVSENEAHAIRQKLPGFVDDFLALGLDPAILHRLKAPLKPLWLTPDSPLPPTPPSFPFTPIILVTASRMVKGSGIEGEYIQGAGDDHEGWASESGLTPSLFWSHSKRLLAAETEEELLELISALVATPGCLKAEGGCDLVKPTDSVYVGPAPAAAGAEYDIIINCTLAPLTAQEGCRVIEFPVPEGKKGIKTLKAGLGGVVSALEGIGAETRVAAVCETGNEVSVVVAVVVLCLWFDDEGKFNKLSAEKRAGIDKAYIRRRLAWITSSRASANPARAALNVVNSYLMDRPA